MKIAIIPARGGSKRIPRKNIKPFCGKPMIAWSIEAALHSGCFDQVIVSTDDREIAEISRSYGAAIPFFRPDELADDYTPTAAVVRHAIDWLRQENLFPQMACCIYATAPFIRPEDIKAGLSLLESSKCDFVLPVTTFAFPIWRALRLEDGKFLRMMNPRFFATRSQELEEVYHDAGQFCWGKCEAWLGGQSAFDAKTLPLMLPRHRVQDIDTEEDWARAEYLYRALVEK